MRRLFFHANNKKNKNRFDPGNLMLLIYVTVVLFFLLFGGLSHVKAEDMDPSRQVKLLSVLPVTVQKIIDNVL
ncbi:hypothetical protein DGMP_35470 [Desulfomarina profundi]|uniref:Uncharacterized protein n=1 Tax=Desulfomarina profundi TaxID=2772557 RepID=A0A8D5JIM7_9BACT|nr:hypothetical protein [Desulfomarina profundi]BCL62854.1 hypothetical protein DGMP_35470 [Desulfomarina profundi]